MPRKLKNWVEAFEDYTEYSGSPARLRRWAAISCLAGVLEKKVWVHTARSNFYPSLYTILVSPPGVGKSIVLHTVRQLWASMEDHKISSSSVSKASLVDELHDAQRTLVFAGRTPPTVEFHSLKILVSELGVFLPEFASEFMNVLTDIYDGYPFKERKRTKNLVIDIPNPQINLLTGTTPSYLTSLLPEGAWDQGFLSRTMLVYAGEKRLVSLFNKEKIDTSMFDMLQKDLEEIGNLYGEIKFTEEAASMIDTWHMGGQEPLPNHPKLQHYLTRRTGHLLKLCQVACVNGGNKLVIDIPEVQLAMDWLFDMEISIPEIFKAMSSGGDGKVMDECWHMLFQYKVRYNKGAPKSLLVEFLARRVPSHAVERLIDLMEKANLIRAVGEKNIGTVYYAKERTSFE